LDELDEFVGFVAVGAGVAEEVYGLFDEGAPFGGARDGDAPAAAEFEWAFASELPKRAEDGVGVDAEDRGQVFGGWEAFAGLASPSAIAWRISPATCSWRSRGSRRSSLTFRIVLVSIAPSDSASSYGVI
jgi:hypothetical protein